MGKKSKSKRSNNAKRKKAFAASGSSAANSSNSAMADLANLISSAESFLGRAPSDSDLVSLTVTDKKNSTFAKSWFRVDGDFGKRDMSVMKDLKDKHPEDYQSLLAGNTTVKVDFSGPDEWDREKVDAYLVELARAVESGTSGGGNQNTPMPIQNMTENDAATPPGPFGVNGGYSKGDFETMKAIRKEAPLVFQYFLDSTQTSPASPQWDTRIKYPDSWSKEEIMRYMPTLAKKVHAEPVEIPAISNRSTLESPHRLRGDFGTEDINFMKTMRQERPEEFLFFLRLEQAVEPPEPERTLCMTPVGWNKRDTLEYLVELAKKVQEEFARPKNASKGQDQQPAENQPYLRLSGDGSEADIVAMFNFRRNSPLNFRLILDGKAGDGLSVQHEGDNLSDDDAIAYMHNLAVQVENAAAAAETTELQKENRVQIAPPLKPLRSSTGFAELGCQDFSSRCNKALLQILGLEYGADGRVRPTKPDDITKQEVVVDIGLTFDDLTEDYLRMREYRHKHSTTFRAFVEKKPFVRPVFPNMPAVLETNTTTYAWCVGFLVEKEAQMENGFLPTNVSHGEFFVSDVPANPDVKSPTKCTSCTKNSRKMVQLYCGHWYCRTCLLTNMKTPYCLECGFDLCLDIYFPVTKKPKGKDVCFWCYKQGPRSSMKVCPGCQTTGDKTTYCSHACQENAWLTHKRTAHAHWEGKE